MPAKDEIERLAYFLWEEEGRPQGAHLRHYYEAERILRERELSMQKSNGVRPEASPAIAPKVEAPKPEETKAEAPGQAGRPAPKRRTPIRRRAGG